MPRPNFSNIEKNIEEIIRVDHAGEFGAQRIYKGQLRFTRSKSDYQIIDSMLKQEEEHLKYFSKEIEARSVRPTALMPIWSLGGYFLGALSSLLGQRGAMLVTDAVEEVIEEHYQTQIEYLKANKIEKTLASKIAKFKEDEAHHRDIAADSGHTKWAERSLIAKVLHKSTKTICSLAINLSKKI